MKTIIKLVATVLFLSTAGCSVELENWIPGPDPEEAAQIAAAVAEPTDPATRQARNDAKRFLDQASFGPTIDAMDRVTALGFEGWIDEQQRLPATLMLPALQALPHHQWNEYVNIWWRHAVSADDQLRQRVAFALSQIFVVSGRDGLDDEQLGMANYYDLLLRNAFGNYRDLLQEVTLNPVMGEYLSMKGNHKTDFEQNIRPDENYARELLQLFSIGLVELNLDGTPRLDATGATIPTYTQDTVEQFAHVFTGWHFQNADHFIWPSVTDYLNPMVAYPNYHATREKTLLRGKVLPQGQTPQQDLNQALNNIFNHPNVGPFISRQLIQKLVTSNPTPQYVADIASVFNANEDGVRGSLGSVVKAILLHDEARRGHLDYPNTFGKLKEPVMRVTGIWRAFQPDFLPVDFNYNWVGSELGQSPLNAASVFNFFTPFYSLPGEISNRGLVSPEFEIHDETSIIKITNRIVAATIWSHNYNSQTGSERIAINISLEVALEEDNRDRLLDHLDTLLLGGRMTDAMRSTLHQLMADYSHVSESPRRVADVIFMIASSPEAAIQF